MRWRNPGNHCRASGTAVWRNLRRLRLSGRRVCILEHLNLSAIDLDHLAVDSKEGLRHWPNRLHRGASGAQVVDQADIVFHRPAVRDDRGTGRRHRLACRGGGARCCRRCCDREDKLGGATAANLGLS